MLKLRSAGDTIIEVLICLAIASSGIAAAYSITAESLDRIRGAQEHAEAQKLAEEQLSRLKQYIANRKLARPDWSMRQIIADNDAGIGLFEKFCMDEHAEIQHRGLPNPEACPYPPDNEYYTGIGYVTNRSNYDPPGSNPDDLGNVEDPNDNMFFIVAGRYPPSNLSREYKFQGVILGYKQHQ